MARYVIIGNGVAGTKAAATIRDADPAGEITILSADARPFYLRPQLADFVAAQVAEAALAAKSPDFYAQKRLTLRLMTTVTAVHPAKRHVHLASGEGLPFDALLIASGGRPVPPPFPGGELDGVLVLKTLADALALKAHLTTAKRVLVVGEGLLGLEMARACRQAGRDITYLLRGESFWPELLDADAAGLVERRLQDSSITLARQATVTEALGSGGRLRYVTTSDGQTRPCDLLCVGLGLQPDIAFLQGSGLAAGAGLTVDDAMATNLPGVFAAGDCVQQTSGLDFGWLRAWEQGIVAGANMAGGSKRYSRLPILSIQAFGLDVMALGQANPTGPEYRRLANDPSQMGIYKKLVLQGDTIVGALLVGDVGEASAIEKLIRDKTLIGQVDQTITRRLFDPYYWETSGKEVLCPVCKFGIKLGAQAQAGDVRTCPICGEEFQLVAANGRLIARRLEA
jgi:NAD(P)H-nitrite reductase large subunit